jgi:hypothetical protein
MRGGARMSFVLWLRPRPRISVLKSSPTSEFLGIYST